MPFGFGGWARFPWGALIASSGNTLLAASPGTATLTGLPESFKISAADGADALLCFGISASFSIKSPETPANFVSAGVANAFRVLEAARTGSLILTGVSTVDMIGEHVSPIGAFAASTLSASFLIAANDRGGAFTQTDYAQTLTRDFVNWVVLPTHVESWSNETPPSPSWTTIGPQQPSWRDGATPAPSWSQIVPPSSNWTADPIQHISPPVSE
jgi:hypothetical protein